jgi:endothelin-converting enzyme
LELTLLQKEAVFNRLEAVTWMDVSTKNSALHKLRSMDVNVVFPDSWEQVKRLERLLTVPLNTSTFMPNVMFMTRGYDRQNFDEFTLPPNKNDWAEIRIDLSKLEGWSKLNEDDVEVSKLEGLAQVNAFYNPQNNSINIPAGIWQPPFYFDEDWIKIPPAVNFGGIAPPLCHEMFHAFDNRGRLFDAHGSLSNWWQDSSAQEFSVRTQCIVDFYNAMHSESGYPINGLSNLGEAIADIGGMRAAYDAYKEFLNEFPAEELSDMTSAIVAAYQGYTHEQLFFITYGQLWCEVETPAEELEQIRSDPHTPAHQRVLGVYANTPEFAAAFNCPLGSNYAPINACEVF